MKLENLLSDIYPADDLYQVCHLLEQFDLTSILQAAIDKVDHFNKGKASDQEQRITIVAGTLASSFLLSVNAKLTQLPLSDGKKKIELVISDIAFELIKAILDNFTGDRRVLLSVINESLKITCEINGYDFSDLSQLMPLQKYIAIQPQGPMIELPSDLVKLVFYRWESNIYNLHDLSETLKFKKIIKRARDFHKLFESPKAHFTICFDPAYHDELIVLFDLLYIKKHIAPIGTRGHFFPFQQYSVDFQNKSFLKKEPKTIKFTLKKNKAKWAGLNDKVAKWLVNFK